MRYWHVLFALVLAGCASGQMLLLESDQQQEVALEVPTESCEGKSASQCTFINSPVKLSSRPIHLPDSPYPFFKTEDRLEFINARGEVWIAPAGILTDGASIPPIFVPFIGDPRSKEFMNAATVHDSYSAESNKDTPYYHAATWQEVHRMFYDALRVSGTPPIKAKIMYAAVYLAGPRWKEVRKPKARRQAHGTHPAGEARMAQAGGGGQREMVLDDGVTIAAAAASARDMQSDTPLPQLFTRQQLINAFNRARAFIRSSNPSIAEVEIYLTKLEGEMASAPAVPNKNKNFRAKEYMPGEQPDTGGEDGGFGEVNNSVGSSASSGNAGSGNAGDDDNGGATP